MGIQNNCHAGRLPKRMCIGQRKDYVTLAPCLHTCSHAHQRISIFIYVYLYLFHFWYLCIYNLSNSKSYSFLTNGCISFKIWRKTTVHACSLQRHRKNTCLKTSPCMLHCPPPKSYCAEEINMIWKNALTWSITRQPRSAKGSLSRHCRMRSSLMRRKRCLNRRANPSCLALSNSSLPSPPNALGAWRRAGK